MEKICGIYKITNPKGKVYIGQSIHIYERWRHYKMLLCIDQPRLYNSLSKYRPDNHSFEILKRCLQRELNGLECFFINYYNSTDRYFGMNILEGGAKAKGLRHTKESKEKISLAHKGKKKSKEHCLKIGLSKIGNKNCVGRKYSTESLKKMSDTRKGKRPLNGKLVPVILDECEDE